MKKWCTRFDPELQMFVEKPKPIKLGTLKFHRYLAEKQNKTVSAPKGDLALGMVILENKPIDKIIGRD